MPILPRLSSLWRNLFHKAREEQELTEELDAYLEMLVEQKIKEGFDPVEARRAALIEHSTASAPELAKNTTSAKLAAHSRPASRSASGMR